jgi:threonine synthase
MFIETRGNDGLKPKKVPFSFAILNPSASFGGLYVPENLPQIDTAFLEKASKKSYKEITLDILKLFNSKLFTIFTRMSPCLNTIKSNLENLFTRLFPVETLGMH